MVFIERNHYLAQIQSLFRSHTVVGLIGPRQCGKTTLAREFSAKFNGEVHHFDLEDPLDLNRLSDARLALDQLSGLIVLDEIQRLPEIFPILRVLVDRPQSTIKVLVLGSASPQLIRQSSESLAGRIAYLELTPFSNFEVSNHKALWLNGGYPPSFLANSLGDSFSWRKNYVSTFLERDLPMLGIDLSTVMLRRLWTMLAHCHGNVLNYSDLSRSLGVTSPTVRRYVDILESTFVVRKLAPWFENVSRRQVKAPKIYLRDSGILHYLLNLSDLASLESYPRLGASWEGFALEQTIRKLDLDVGQAYFWRLHSGSEIDLLVVKGNEREGFEFKYSSTPKATRSMYTAIEELRLDRLTVIHPGEIDYPLTDQIDVMCLSTMMTLTSTA